MGIRRRSPSLAAQRCKRRRWPLPLALLGAVMLLLTGVWPAHTASAGMAPPPIPVLAYYYIWYNLNSWDRGKSDLPQIGPYSSDDRAVMRQHIRLAKKAGIGGFIVSWKSTVVLNRRLQRLIKVAADEDFKLSIIYQGLDFERHPVPASQVAADLDYFTTTFANNKVFNMFARPLVIWSGTWEFSRDDIEKVVTSRREHLLILASERKIANYQRVANLVDGNAYYWSSVDPDTHPEYEEKLGEMGYAVHSAGGLWIAPAAPGFDARLVGGTRVVERKDGATLQQQMDAAIKSSPDAIGLISWNEFSENSHLEPSRNYGDQYLKVLASRQATTPTQTLDFDSSEPANTQVRTDSLMVLGGLVALVLASIGVIVWREVRKNQPGSRSW
jgi:hypothetical protein